MKTFFNTLIAISIPALLWVGGYHFSAIGTMLALAGYAVFSEGVWQRRVGR